ncbi:hypothetical protein VIGAN_06117100, partial [Vigna angularis var. angularis]
VIAAATTKTHIFYFEEDSLGNDNTDGWKGSGAPKTNISRLFSLRNGSTQHVQHVKKEPSSNTGYVQQAPRSSKHGERPACTYAVQRWKGSNTRKRARGCTSSKLGSCKMKRAHGLGPWT